MSDEQKTEREEAEELLRQIMPESSMAIVNFYAHGLRETVDGGS